MSDEEGKGTVDLDANDRGAPACSGFELVEQPDADVPGEQLGRRARA